MPSEEYEQLKEALKQAPTEEARKAAAEAMRRYLEKKGKGSKPTLVTLRRGGGKDNAIPLDELPEAMIRSPQVYDRMRKIVTKEK